MRDRQRKKRVGGENKGVRREERRVEEIGKKEDEKRGSEEKDSM